MFRLAQGQGDILIGCVCMCVCVRMSDICEKETETKNNFETKERKKLKLVEKWSGSVTDWVDMCVCHG